MGYINEKERKTDNHELAKFKTRLIKSLRLAGIDAKSDQIEIINSGCPHQSMPKAIKLK